ncbi:MAG: hypothetical protein U0573_07605 [Phycisphaerales bacterium]|nr:hypothetical protein [Planctomycetota bacterium]
MKSDSKEVAIENRLAAAEAQRENQILDRILRDMERIKTQSPAQVETRGPRLVLVYG